MMLGDELFTCSALPWWRSGLLMSFSGPFCHTCTSISIVYLRHPFKAVGFKREPVCRAAGWYAG